MGVVNPRFRRDQKRTSVTVRTFEAKGRNTLRYGKLRTLQSSAMLNPLIYCKTGTETGTNFTNSAFTYDTLTAGTVIEIDYGGSISNQSNGGLTLTINIGGSNFVVYAESQPVGNTLWGAGISYWQLRGRVVISDVSGLTATGQMFMECILGVQSQNSFNANNSVSVGQSISTISGISTNGTAGLSATISMGSGKTVSMTGGFAKQFAF